MESREWPKAMIKAMAPICGQMVPLNQPRASSLNWILAGTGRGGSCACPWRSKVIGHQMRKATTMTVVICMSDFETLAQVYREIAYPKMKNLIYTGNLVCLYAVFCPGFIPMFAAMIIPVSARGHYADNLLGGLAMHLAGPHLLRLLFRIFVVFVGVLILSGAVNTSIIGGNGVMNRLAEDGVLVDWFRKPHKRFGTSARMINVIAGLQLFTIFLSRGDVNLLGEAYAFGVVWSFFMKSLSVLVLRYKRHDQEYKVPANFRI